MARVPTCHPEAKHYGKGLCKPCYSAKAYEDNKDVVLTRAKAAYEADPDVKRARVQRHREKNPEAIAERKRKAYAATAACTYLRLYGMSVADIEAMLELQGRKCGVCADEIDMATKRVDHCHSTGYVRGLLCWNCNTAIGKLGDNIEGIKKALAYLEKEPSKFKAV